MKSLNELPRLPATAQRVASRLPLAPLAIVAERVLRTAFQAAIADGELDFLADREVVLHVEDAGVALAFRFENGTLRCGRPCRPDASVRGPLAAYILLASKRADADTLFFQRVLIMDGDTELGLGVKYLLEAMPLDTQPHWLRLLLAHAAARLQSLPETMPAAPRQ